MACRLAISYSSVMSADEIRQLPLRERLQIMEAIWEDLRQRADRFEIPQEQKDLLDARRARVERVPTFGVGSRQRFSRSSLIKIAITEDAFSDFASRHNPVLKTLYHRLLQDPNFSLAS